MIPSVSFSGIPSALCIPLVSGLIFAAVPSYKLAAKLNIVAALLTFLATLGLFTQRPAATDFFLVDDLNVYLLALTSFMLFTISIFSAKNITREVESGKLKPAFVRFYHAIYQTYAFTLMLALFSNNLGVMWVAIEGATLTTVLLIGLYRTPEALEASWMYFILCGVGIALALFGTTLIYLAAQPVLGAGMPSLTWSALLPRAADFSTPLLNIAFVFVLIGYGTKAGIAPMNAWMPDAYGESPTPAALLSGLVLNVSVYAILRFKIILAGSTSPTFASPLMIFLGLGSLLFAAFMLYRRAGIKRLFAFSSMEHMGIITFAFGLGGPLANFAGLLHMAMHALTKSAIFFVVGDIVQVLKTKQIADIKGLTTSVPMLGWALVIGIVAIVGLPPFGVFTSEFILVTTTFSQHPLLAVPLVLGLLVAFGALVQKLQAMAFGSAEVSKEQVGFFSMLPFFVHVGLVLLAGIYLPGPLVTLFQNVARMIG